MGDQKSNNESQPPLKPAFPRLEEAKADMLISVNPTLASAKPGRGGMLWLPPPICSSFLEIVLSNTEMTSNFKSQASGRY